MKSKWINSADEHSNPSHDYFLEHKLDIWLKYCETFDDAHNRITDLILNGYMVNFSQVALKKIAGQVVNDALLNLDFLTNNKVQANLIDLIVKSANVNSVLRMII